MQSNSSATGTIEEIGRRDHEVTSEYRIYGPPGCGKTTSLTRQIRRAVDRFGADTVLVTSFSRAAAAELAGRDLPIAGDRVGTLHSHCYHALGAPEIAEANVEEWNRDNPQLAITAVKKHGKLDGEETGEEDDSGLAKDGDGFLQHVSRFRGMQLPERAWSPNLREFAQLWTEYKQANGLMDFTDLIETCLRDVALAPKNPSVIFADEAQDLNKLQLALIRKWGERAEYFIVAGDDDQCSLPGTLVRTQLGDVPVEALDPAKHRIVAYSSRHAELIGGNTFEKVCRPHEGDVITVRAGERATRCTTDHKWLIKWNHEAARNAHCVYLMRRGARWKVGWCKLMHADRCFHLAVRTRCERADEAWVLAVFSSRTEASIHESLVATKYGLPLILFQENPHCPHYNQHAIDSFFERLDESEMAGRAVQCLAAHDRDVRFPVYRRSEFLGRCHGSTIMRVEACNLLPGLMLLPVPANAKHVAWMPFDISRSRYCGPVYALNPQERRGAHRAGPDRYVSGALLVHA